MKHTTTLQNHDRIDRREVTMLMVNSKQKYSEILTNKPCVYGVDFSCLNSKLAICQTSY